MAQAKAGKKLSYASFGQGTSAQRAVHMDIAVGEKFRAGADRRHHHQVAALGVDLLAATQDEEALELAWLAAAEIVEG